MKQTAILSFTALALILAMPELALAKSGTHIQSMPKAKIKSPLVKSAPAVIDEKSSGLIDTTANGQGTYTSTETGTAADKTIITTDDFANGKDYTFTTNIIEGSNGALTKNTVTDSPNGVVTTRDEVLTSTGVKGDYDITGFTTQNGKVDTFTGIDTTTKYGSDATFTIVSYNDKIEKLNYETLSAGNTTASVTTGTGFSGQAINGASLTVNTSVPGSNAVTTTVDGQGTYYSNVTKDPGLTIVDSGRQFNDGTTTTTVTTKTVNANGSTTNNSSYTYVPTVGQDSSSQAIMTYTNEGAGNVAINGSYSQSNGDYGAVSGTKVSTVSGSNTDLTYTNQDGATKTADTQTLSAGGAVFNINTGTSFNGQPNNSIGLIASASN